MARYFIPRYFLPFTPHLAFYLQCGTLNGAPLKFVSAQQLRIRPYLEIGSCQISMVKDGLRSWQMKVTLNGSDWGPDTQWVSCHVKPKLLETQKKVRWFGQSQISNFRILLCVWDAWEQLQQPVHSGRGWRTESNDRYLSTSSGFVRSETVLLTMSAVSFSVYKISCSCT